MCILPGKFLRVYLLASPLLFCKINKNKMVEKEGYFIQRVITTFNLAVIRILGVKPSPRDSMNEEIFAMSDDIRIANKENLCESHPTWRLWRNLHTKNMSESDLP